MINKADASSSLNDAMLPTDNKSLPVVLFIGGSDVDRRIDLMARLRKGFHVVAAGSDQAIADRFEKAGFQYHYYKLSRRVDPISDLHSLWNLASICRKLKPCIVHTFDTKPNVLGRIAASIAGVPTIIGTVTGLGYLYASNGRYAKITRCIYESVQRVACTLADKTIFQNHEDAQYYSLNRIVRASKSLIIPGSGVRTDLFDRDDYDCEKMDGVRSSLGIGSDEIVITTVCRVIRSKGVLEFAEAAQRIGAVHTQVRFVLAGEVDKEGSDNYTNEEIEQINRSVTWLGARNDIANILAISNIFVLFTSYREGIPRSLMEAASMSLPIITTRMPGCMEVVIPGHNGIVVEMKDVHALVGAIMRLVEQSKIRKEYGIASRRLAKERFDIENIARSTELLYNNILISKGINPGSGYED
jgi:glycosyltransferase involved in cell wall biosynthesis